MPAPSRPTVDLDRRLRAMEECSAAASTAALYFELCDVPTPHTDVRAGLEHVFTDRSTWAGLGDEYRQEFGEVTGRDAVVDRVLSYLPPSPHFTRNVHLLTAPQLDGDGDGTVTGRWMMQQLSTYPDGRQELRCARIAMSFVVDDHGTTRIATFATERLYDALLPPSLQLPIQPQPTRRITARNVRDARAARKEAHR